MCHMRRRKKHSCSSVSKLLTSPHSLHLYYIILFMKGDEGILGLCKGAKATLVIPPEMGYGARGAGRDIPGGATVS